MSTSVNTKTPPSRVGRWQFTLTSLLVLLLIAAGGFAWLGYRLRQRNEVWVNVDFDNTIRIDGRAVSLEEVPAALEQVCERLRKRSHRPDEAVVHLAIHDKAACARMRDVTRLCQQAHFRNFLLQLDAETFMPLSMPEEKPDAFCEMLPPIKIRLSANPNGELANIKMGERRIASMSQLRSEIRGLAGSEGDETGFEVCVQPDDQLRVRYFKQACLHSKWYLQGGKRRLMIGTIRPARTWWNPNDHGLEELEDEIIEIHEPMAEIQIEDLIELTEPDVSPPSKPSAKD